MTTPLAAKIREGTYISSCGFVLVFFIEEWLQDMAQTVAHTCLVVPFMGMGSFLGAMVSAGGRVSGEKDACESCVD